MRTAKVVASCSILACLLGTSTPLAMLSSVPEPPADTGLDRSMVTMDADMQKVRYSGNPDSDFALMMIPHHQGAIEMAKVELQFGADPRLRRLAQEIIVTQQSEIEVLKGAIRDYPASSLSEKRRTNWCTQ